MESLGMLVLGLQEPHLLEGHFYICFSFHTELGVTQEEYWRREPCSTASLVGPVTPL